jgi:spermidine synthase
LRVYAILEIGIGFCGVAVLHFMPAISHWYAGHVGSDLVGILTRGGVAAVCLLPPTILMGATLPAVARWIESTPAGVASLGVLYGGNIAGAVFGCLLAGFYLLRVHDVETATWVAVSINFAVAAVGLVLAARAPHRPPSGASEGSPVTPVHGAGAVYLTIALSGLCALGAEVVWTRLLSLLLGGTVYTFAIILAVFLVGLGIGSSVGSSIARHSPRPRLALGTCQMLLAAAIAWTAWQLSDSLPYWPIDLTLTDDAWLTFQLDLVRCAWAVFPAAFLWGASFPLALGAVSSAGSDAGRLVGQVYAANTVGAIAGAVGVSVLFIRWVGTQHTQQVLIGISALAAVLALVPPLFARSGDGVISPASIACRVGGAFAIAAALGGAGWLAWRVPDVSGELIAYGRFVAREVGRAMIDYKGEGMNSSVAVSISEGGTRSFHVSGKVEASSEPQDMRLQRMLGHIPAVFHPHPRKVLVVGCGAGVTAGSFVVHPEVERIVICELEPLIPKVVVNYFSQENHNVVTDPRVQLVIDDARHFILTTTEKFDVITSDPIHPWVKGAATLYTEEYLELCRQHLNPGGVISQWVPLYESNTAAVKSEIATIFKVFPHASIWGNDVSGEGYDVVLLGHAEPMRIDVDKLQERLNRSDHALVAESLSEVGFQTALDLVSTYAGQASDLEKWLKDAEINRDRNLRLQYLAGMGSNLYHERRIYDEILSHRGYPDGLLVATDKSREELMRRMGLVKPAP